MTMFAAVHQREDVFHRKFPAKRRHACRGKAFRVLCSRDRSSGLALLFGHRQARATLKEVLAARDTVVAVDSRLTEGFDAPDP